MTPKQQVFLALPTERQKMQRALLRWCHETDAEFSPRTAHHFINWAGAEALAACTTPADYTAVTECFTHANQIILGEQNDQIK